MGIAGGLRVVGLMDDGVSRGGMGCLGSRGSIGCTRYT